MNQNQKSQSRRVKFGEVVRLSKARSQDPLADGLERYVGLEHLEPGDLRIHTWGNVADGTTFTSRFEPGQVLFGKRRAYQRKVAVADFSGVCSGDIYVLEPKDHNALLPELLPFICQTDAFFDHAVGTSAGSLSPRTNWTSLASFEYVLPPIETQYKIVQLLRASEDLCDEQSRALGHLSGVRQSFIDRMDLGNPGVAKVRLAAMVTMQNGRPFPGEEYADCGVKLLRPGNLGVTGYLHWTDENTVYLDPKWTTRANEFVIRAGDVLINLTAQSLEDGFMGRVCLAEGNDISLLNQRIGRFRFNSDRLLPEFLFRCLQTARFRQHAHANCEGSKVKHLFWQHLAKFEICVPDIATQQRTVFQCSEIDSAIKALTGRISESNRIAARLRNQFAGAL